MRALTAILLIVAISGCRSTKETSVRSDVERVKYVQRDSLAPGWTLKPPAFTLKDLQDLPVGEKQTTTTADNGAELRYWIDQYGQLHIECEEKDKLITKLRVEAERSTVVTEETVVEKPVTPKWAWWTLGISMIAVLGVTYRLSKLFTGWRSGHGNHPGNKFKPN